MSPRRRLLLFLPLVILTLFFAALGWRNWHLPMDEEEVWADVPRHFFSSPPEIGSTSFLPHQRTVVGMRDKVGGIHPVSAALFSRLRELYPQWPIVNFPQPYRSDTCEFTFDIPDFTDRFSVSCSAVYVPRTPHDEFSPATVWFTLFMKRSPLALRADRWYLTKCNETFSG